MDINTITKGTTHMRILKIAYYVLMALLGIVFLALLVVPVIALLFGYPH